MSTRAIVATIDAEVGWIGVWNHWSGGPDELGTHLIKVIMESGGNLNEVARLLVLDAPEGWSSIIDGKRAETTGGRRYYRPADLDECDSDVHDVHFFYLIDPQTRTLSAIEATVDNIRGLKSFAKVTFAENGQPSIDQMPEPPPPWSTLRVVSHTGGWTDETRARAHRVREAMSARFGPQSPRVRERMLQCLKRLVLDALPAGADLSSPIVASWNWSPEAEAHEVDLGDLRLRYGAPAEWRDNDVQLIDAEGRSAWLTVDVDAWISTLAAHEGEEEDARQLIWAVVETVASATAERRYELVDGEIFWFRTVTTGPSTESEIELAEARLDDPHCEVGDAFGQLPWTSAPWFWELVDWLFER